MYLTKPERKAIMSAYGCESFIEDNHYQVEPDVWVYLFRDGNDKKYVLIAADFIDYYYDVFPHLLKYDNGEFKEIEFVLQQEIPAKNNIPETIHINTILFEYTD